MPHCLPSAPPHSLPRCQRKSLMIMPLTMPNPQRQPTVRPAWVTKGAIVLRECPQTHNQTLFVLQKLQQQRGTTEVYLNAQTERYPLRECRAASWADFSTLRTLQVGHESWLVTHPQQQLAVPEHTDSEDYWLVVSEVYTAALQLAAAFNGSVVLPQSESLAASTEQLSVQWADEMP